MKIVYSCWGYYNKKNNYIDNSLIYISLKSVKKYGYKTILYTDEKHYDRLKNFEFDDIIIFDQKELNTLPFNIWCLGKLLACSKIKEPFCHIDFDIIVLNDIIRNFYEKKLFCFHEEPWRIGRDYDILYNENFPKLEGFEKIYNNNIKTYNCATIGGNSFKEINYSANIVLEFCRANKDFFEKTQAKFLKNSNHWLVPVFLEQVMFMNICKNKIGLEISPIYDLSHLNLSVKEKKNWEFVYDIMFKEGLIHLWGAKEGVSKILNRFLTKK